MCSITRMTCELLSDAKTYAETAIAKLEGKVHKWLYIYTYIMTLKHGFQFDLTDVWTAVLINKNLLSYICGTQSPWNIMSVRHMTESDSTRHDTPCWNVQRVVETQGMMCALRLIPRRYSLHWHHMGAMASYLTVIWLCVQQFIHANNYENIGTLHYWIVCMRVATGHRGILIPKSQWCIKYFDAMNMLKVELMAFQCIQPNHPELFIASTFDICCKTNQCQRWLFEQFM